MNHESRFFVFQLAGQRYAIPLAVVDQVVHAVEYTILPKAPDIVLGIINARGRVIPLINIRRRFCLPEREVALTDQIIIAHTARRPVALLVDDVEGIFENPEQKPVSVAEILPDTEYCDAVVKLPDGLVLIHDLDRFLSLEEADTLDRALEGN